MQQSRPLHKERYDQRQAQRVLLSLPVEISFGSQITLQGQLKDISLKSAFIKVKSSIYMQPNDELSFAIKKTPESPEGYVHGMACIARVEPGEGIAIYFTKMDESSTTHLKELLNAS